MVMASISWVFSSCAEVSVHLIGLENQKKEKQQKKKTPQNYTKLIQENEAFPFGLKMSMKSAPSYRNLYVTLLGKISFEEINYCS